MEYKKPRRKLKNLKPTSLYTQNSIEILNGNHNKCSEDLEQTHAVSKVI